MNKFGWYYMTAFMLAMLGFIYCLYSLERGKEQANKEHCEAIGGVYVRPYKSGGNCLQIIDWKLKEVE